MKALPELITQRLFLSAFSRSDIPDIFSYASNPDVARFTSWAAHNSTNETEAWLHFVSEHESSEPSRTRHCWAIRLQDRPKAIGAIEFSQTTSDQARIDYVLTQEHWNQGLMTEAAASIVNWAFQTMPDLQRVDSSGLTENIGSIRVMQKCGMKLQKKELQRFVKFGNEEHEHSHYGITRSEWEESANQAGPSNHHQPIL